MRYFLWGGGIIIITSLVIHIRSRNALLQYLQDAKLNNRVNRPDDDLPLSTNNVLNKTASSVDPPFDRVGDEP